MIRFLFVFLALSLTPFVVATEEAQSSIDPNACEPNGEPGEILFCFEADGEIISTPAIAEDGTIYFGTLNAIFYAVDCNGGLKWEWKYDRPPEMGGPQAFEASPVIGDDGTIYVGDDIAIPNFFFALSPEGMMKWEYETAVVYGAMDASPALLSDGTIFAGAHGFSGWDGPVGQLVALTPGGDVLTGFPLETGAIEASPVVFNDVVVIGETVGWANCNKIYAINRHADILWETQSCWPAALPYFSSLAMDHRNAIVVAENLVAYSSKIWLKSQVIHLDPYTGERLCQLPVTHKSVVVGSPIIDTTKHGSCVILATQDGHVILLDLYTDGDKLIYDHVLCENSSAVGSPVIADNGMIYHAVNSVHDVNQIVIIEYDRDDPIGQNSQFMIPNDHVSSSLTMGPGGILYFGSKAGKLYAIQTGAQGLSKEAPWPTFRHDVRNTGNPVLPSLKKEDLEKDL